MEGCAQLVFMCVVFTVFRGEFAEIGHVALFKALRAVTILFVLWLVPALAHPSEAGFSVDNCFQAQS
jgi:hypothetical protein